MDFQEYDRRTAEITKHFNNSIENQILFSLLGLSGEVGEVHELFKKAKRDGQELDLDLLKKELGDVLSNIATLAHPLGITLEEIAIANLEKLEGRVARGTLHGSGNNR